MADLSKIKLGNVTYDLKDATARANLSTLIGTHALEALQAAAWMGVDEAVTAGATGLPTNAAVKSYVDAQVGAINKFDVRIYQADSEGKPNVTASAQTMYILASVADAHAAAGTYIEYITVRTGTDPNYSYAWEKIGSTQADLSDYLQKTATVAGVAFGDDQAISKAELEAADALDLKALAHKASATGTVAGETITGVKATGNVDLELEGALAQTSTAANLTKGNYTPAGNVSVTLSNAGVLSSVNSAGTVPSFTEGAFTANVPTEIDVTAFNAGALPTKAADSFTAPSFTEGAFDAGSLPSLGNASKSAFATEGLVGEVGTGDDAETLILTAASTSQAVTDQGTFSAGSLPSKAADTFTAGSFTEGAFTQGSLPSLGNGFYTPGTAASKASDSFSAGSMPTFNEATVGVQSASFSGTEAENILVTAVNYDKTSIGTLDVKAADIELNVGNIVVADKSVTVE